MMYEYMAQIERIVDADTFDLRLDLGFHVSVRERCRLYGVNAPEKRTPEGEAAIRYVEGQLVATESYRITTLKDKQGKYGRFLVVLWLHPEVSLNDRLVSEGHAIPAFYSVPE